MAAKERLKEVFSADPDRYYRVELFDRAGYRRRKCSKCGKFFWTQTERRNCPDQPCTTFGFIGSSPTSRKFGYSEAWRAIEEFFVSNGHTSVRRYPVVCRWRPDLFFTVASIVDFQRVDAGKVVFELPANPLVVPQMCLRFNDIQNVGMSGRHFSSFCMVGQHSITDGGGYWKDECIELDHRLLTEVFGIGSEEIDYVEDVWVGYGAFGYSLEYFVRGLELGNAVFTQFEGTPDDYREMDRRVIDMGAGLERFAWMGQGTPTSYDAVFPETLARAVARLGISAEEELLVRYQSAVGLQQIEDVVSYDTVDRAVASALKIPYAEMVKRLRPIRSLYALLDHTRTLVFAIADGALPSNVGGGHNLRVMVRRALDLIESNHFDIDLTTLSGWHGGELASIYPELREHEDEVRRILEVEERRYSTTKEKIGRIVGELSSRGGTVDQETAVRLYDSDGVTPELLTERGLKVEIEGDFYQQVALRHLAPKYEVERPRMGLEGLPPTELLYYRDQDLFSFKARVLKVFGDGQIVLDRTAFYPRGGGQEPDMGTIDGVPVSDVEKIGDVVVHKLKGVQPDVDQTVSCEVDSHRRGTIMRHHTATHILNGASRKVLGSWIWQHSAFKDVDKARLDITHYSGLTSEEIERIEDLANEIVRRNLPVTVEYLPRAQAESKYGFRLYQGGVIPVKTLRVISVGDFDVEACGGTHCRSTGEVGLIKMVRAERIQDGVVRMEFVAGERASKLFQEKQRLISQISGILNVLEEKLEPAILRLREDLDLQTKRAKSYSKRLSDHLAEEAMKKAERISGFGIYVTSDPLMDEGLHVATGERLASKDTKIVYCGLWVSEGRVRIVVFCGKDAIDRGAKAGELVKEASSILGGSGGGSNEFAQGGGNRPERLKDAAETLRKRLLSLFGQG